jgi:hypothetical protein
LEIKYGGKYSSAVTFAISHGFLPNTSGTVYPLMEQRSCSQNRGPTLIFGTKTNFHPKIGLENTKEINEKKL